MNARTGSPARSRRSWRRYLAFKQTMGFYGASRIWYLRRFDAYCARHGRTVFDRDTVEGWVHRATGAVRPVPVLDVVHPRLRPLAAGPQNADAYVLSDRWKAPFVPRASVPAQHARRSIGSSPPRRTWTRSPRGGGRRSRSSP